jgi:hypothetical protein
MRGRVSGPVNAFVFVCCCWGSGQTLQRIAYKHFRESLDDFALKNVGAVSSKEQLVKYFGMLSDEQLVDLAARLRILPRPGGEEQPGLVTRLPPLSREFVSGVAPHVAVDSRGGVHMTACTTPWCWCPVTLCLAGGPGGAVTCWW